MPNGSFSSVMSARASALRIGMTYWIYPAISRRRIGSGMMDYRS
jgi:hypothetical protein